MKLTFTVLLAFAFTLLFGQQLEFNGELVDSIFIKSHERVSNFSSKRDRDAMGKANMFSVAYDTMANEYVLDEYYEDVYSLTYSPDSLYLKVKDLKAKNKKPIHYEDLNNLLLALNRNVDSKTFLNQMDTTFFKEYVTKKRIRKAARRYDVNWYFKKRYSTKEENELFYESCQSIDTLTLFIDQDVNTNSFTHISSYSNTFRIWITTTSAEFKFTGRYPSSGKQPWFKHRDGSMPISVLNLDINYTLLRILPYDFFQRESITIEALFDEYIKWYFRKREMS